MDESVQIVLGKDVIRDELAGYGDKFGAFEVSAQEEVDDIEVGKSGISAVIATIGDDRVKKGANGGGIGSSCGDNARVIILSPPMVPRMWRVISSLTSSYFSLGFGL